MSITPLSAARIAGEVGLAGGTITGGTYAAQYASKITAVTGERDKEKTEKKKIYEDKQKAEQAARSASADRDVAMQHKSATSATAYDTAKTQYLLNEYFLKKHSAAIPNEAKILLMKWNLCLYGHLSVDEGDNCKNQRAELQSKLNHFGFRFT